MTISAFAAMLGLVATGTLVAAYQAAHRAAAMASQTPSPGLSSHVTKQPKAGGNGVAIAPAVAGQAQAQPVAAFLKTYFTSINSRDYLTYSSLFIPQMRESLPHFVAGYQSTTDSGATLAGLLPIDGQSLAATVTFTSRQNPADSPNHAACDRWEVVLTLTAGGGGWVITRTPPADDHVAVQACA